MLFLCKSTIIIVPLQIYGRKKVGAAAPTSCLWFDVILLSSVNHLATHVGDKGFGDADALFRLVVLEDGCHDARQGEG